MLVNLPEEIHIRIRVNSLRLKAADKYGIPPYTCHVGHLVLQALLDRPNEISQIDAATDAKETNKSVATRSMRLADAMANHGLKPGDQVVIMGYNHLDMVIPFYACHYNGYSLCAIDPSIILTDLTTLFKYIQPKMVFCPKSRESDMKDALAYTDRLDCHVVTFDNNNLETFIKQNKGTEVDFRPAEFDHSTTIAWLMLTSGTTGQPKVAVIPYDTLLQGICSWWSQFTKKWNMTLAMATCQWMSSLYFFISTPLMMNVRLQSSVPLTPQLLLSLINKYRPNVTAWTPYLLGQFLNVAGNYCDLSCFKYIAIGGSSVEKPLYDKFQEKCGAGAYLYLVYGMTELLVPVFDFSKNTPFGSTGKEYKKFQYQLVGEEGEIITEPLKTGELWIKGSEFFKGYLNNAEETDKILHKDGWVMTGDMFYKDDNGFYYFVERKRLLIKYQGNWIPPLQLEEVINRHPEVEVSCVTGIPDAATTETPVAAVVKRQNSQVSAQEIFDHVKAELPELKQLHGGLIFVESLPTTPSGKIHRAKIREITLTTERTMPSSNHALTTERTLRS